MPGVSDVTSGYTGGTLANPTYEDVTSETSGHYESVRITYDPARVTYAEILRLWKINRLVHDDGFLPIRKVPGLGGEITDPRNGAWQVWATENDEPRLVATGNYWGCDYCSHRDVCIADGPGRVEIRGRS